MADKMRTVARFSLPMEAELAKNRLEARGIPAYLMGEETTGMWNLGGAFGEVQLQVAEDQFQQAVDILESDPTDIEARTLQDNSPAPESGSAVRTCLQCGLELSGAIRTCPQCGSDVGSPDEAGFLSPVTETRQEEIQEDDRELEVSPGDELATRAWRAAIVGIFLLPPLVTLYSIWLLIRLASYEGDVSDAGIRKGVGAFIINTIILVLALAFLQRFFG